MDHGVDLQLLIGVDKKNPKFTLCRSPSNPGKIYVFFGAALMEIVPEDKKDPEFKLLIARLYNSGVKAKVLTEVFGIARTTMKRWGEALKSGNPERLVEALSGQGPPRKLTPEIRGFISVRFPKIYRETHYDYSARIRQEIKEVFNTDISSETLRSLFNELKKSLNSEESGSGDKEIDKQEGANNGNSGGHKEEVKKEGNSGQEWTDAGNPQEISAIDNRRNLLAFYRSGGRMVFCHHLGVLLFSSTIIQMGLSLKEKTTFIKQWLAAVLLGALNIEQTKLLDFACLGAMFGSVVRSLHLQRSELMSMASRDNVNLLLKYNANMVEASQYSDFYFDPHTKHYTGIKKILKGWVASLKGVDKVLNMDFIHTSGGEPIFVEYADNFYNLRERFMKTVGVFRQAIEFSDESILTFIYDRGVYALEVFQHIIDSRNNHFIVWEKGYRRDGWEEEKISGEFSLTRSRNNSTDLLRYKFTYIDQIWKRHDGIRQIIVQATNPKDRTIEVSILTDDKERRAEEVVKLMFHRWIQENDFKYLDRHFGINEITSYAATHYKKLEKITEDKRMRSGVFKALESERKKIKSVLASLLLKEHTGKRKNKNRQYKIQELTGQLKEVETEMGTTEKEVSRLQSVIEEEYHRLDTMSKSMMDSIKIIARNMFYQALQPFKALYDNYRDDHMLFRNLTRSHGCASFGEKEVEVALYPTAQYQPKVRRIMETYLQQVNEREPVMPDGSGRTIRFKLGEKTRKLFAIPIGEKQSIY